MEKCGKIWKNGRFSRRLWPDRGTTAWAAMAGLGPKGYFWDEPCVGVITMFYYCALAPKFHDSKSARCQVVSRMEIELFKF